MVGLHVGGKIMKIRLFILTECTNVTDRQTHTDKHRMTAKAALDASRGKKHKKTFVKDTKSETWHKNKRQTSSGDVTSMV